MFRKLLAASAIALSSIAQAALHVEVGDTGLREVTRDGVQLLAAGRGRDIRVFNYTPRIVRTDGTTFVPTDKAVVTSPRPWRIVQTYPWGTIECQYSVSDDRLGFSLRVTNSSSTNSIAALELHLVELAFPSVPQGRISDAGMFGMGGKWQALNRAPLTADPAQMPPVIFVQYDATMMAFASEGDPSSLQTPKPGIPFTTTPITALAYPLVVSFSSIAPGKTVGAEVSIRFDAADVDDAYLAGDIFQRYAESFPFTLDWPDRRAIGALFLATSQKHPAKNPRGWFLNAPDVDVTTPEGLAQWRRRLMSYADTAIKVLGDLNAQAMIVWDPEGEEFPQATYYGDPRLTSRLAPETDFTTGGQLGALDEFFQRFRDAGFATGVTIRPQAIEFLDGIPKQHLIADPTAELLDKIAYARQRWGCTIFYVDSTYDAVGALSADVFREIMERFPDILLLPENENFRDFAYTAPLNSFHHHGVTSTPPSVRKVYGDSFSAILSTTSEDKMRAGRDALVEAVRQGDVLIVNAWYPGKHVDFVKGIYQDAGR